MTCAPGSAGRSSPRVRLAKSTSKPPEPRPSSSAWTFTMTSSPSATGPVKRGYAMHARPSTSRRTRPSFRSPMLVTVPRRRLSTACGLDELERHSEHPVQVVHRDLLVGCVDVSHPVGEVHAGEAALVEDVRVRPAADFHGSRRETCAFERGEGQPYRGIVGTKTVAAVA